MQNIFGLICTAGAVVSLLYALYAMFIKKKPEDVTLDSALRSMTGSRQRGVKESSRILQPDPLMRKATDAADEVPGEPAYEPGAAPSGEAVQDESSEEPEYEEPEYEEPEEAGEEQSGEADEPFPAVQAEEAPEDMPEEHQTEEQPAEDGSVQAEPDQEPQSGAEESFFEGLDEDIKSDYHERQSLESKAEHEESAQPVEDSPEDEVYNVDSEFQETAPSDADFYGAGAGVPEAPVLESDDVLESQEPGEEPEYEEISDTSAPEEGEQGAEETEEFDFFNKLEEEQEQEKPGPAEISAAFDNLAGQAFTASEETDEETGEDADSDGKKEQEGDDTLFS